MLVVKCDQFTEDDRQSRLTRVRVNPRNNTGQAVAVALLKDEQNVADDRVARRLQILKLQAKLSVLSGLLRKLLNVRYEGRS